MASKTPKRGLISRMFSPMRLASVSFMSGIKDEIGRIVEKYLAAVGSFALALFFFSFFWMLLNAMVVVLFVEYLKVNLFVSLLIVAMVNLFIAIIFAMAGKNNLDKK